MKKSGNPSEPVPEHPALSSGGGGDDLSFRQAIRIVRKRKRVIYLMVLGCGVLTCVVSSLLTPYYAATNTIQIEQQQNDPLSGALGSVAGSLGGSDDTKTEIETQTSILQTDQLGLEVIERIHFEDQVKKGWDPLGGWKRIPSEVGLPLSQAPRMRERLLKKFNNRLTIDPIANTRLIQVSFEDPDAKYAADSTNILIDQYIKDLLSRRNTETLQGSEWMSGQIADLNKQVQASQQRLIDYQKASGLIEIPTTSPTAPGAMPVVQNPILDRLIQINQDLVTAEVQRISRESIYEIAKSGDPKILAGMTSEAKAANPGDAIEAGEFAGLDGLRQQQVALQLKQAAATQTYGAKNPFLVDINKQIAEIDRQVSDEVQRIIERTGMDYRVAQKAEDGLREAYHQAEEEANKMNDSQIRLAVLQQEADSSRALYEDLYTKLQESQLEEGIQSSNVSIISPAMQPFKASHPKVFLYTFIGVFAGFFFGIVLVFVRENLDDAVVTSSDVEDITGVPVLGSIVQFDSSASSQPGKKQEKPKAGGGKTTIPAGGWVTAEPRSQAAEAYRALRTTLLLSQAGAPPRTILLTSSLPSEGKTTTTYNLAVCFAVLGKKVLAIDADLRKPSLHRHLRLDNTKGLSNLLTSPVDPNEVILKDPTVENLSILCGGPIPPNPAELVGSTTFSNLLGELEKKFDFILIDTPPAMLVADSIIMAAKVDAVVLVVRSESTTKTSLLRVTENLRRSKANLLGFVLNGVNAKSTEYYYNYGYYGGSYSGEYYDKTKS